MIERLLARVRQCVLFRHGLIEARALENRSRGCRTSRGTGVIRLGGRARIVEANDRAVELLRQGAAVSARDGGLHAVHPADDAKPQQLLVRAVSPVGPGAAGSMLLRRPLDVPRLVLHVAPVGGRLTGGRIRRVAALVLIRDLTRRPRFDAGAVASALGLTPSESSVARNAGLWPHPREIATPRAEETARCVGI
ncbi:MAG: hypothetical protein OXG72_05885 [Acidobacteria bacterium]|nr:hypothetical protein [Acidobacteriota bacterium]